MLQEKLKTTDSVQLSLDLKYNEQPKQTGEVSPLKSPMKRKNIIVLKEDEDPYVLELEEKIDDYERELMKRNESIFSIQRNFESISQISRTLKAENEKLKNDMQRYKIKSDRYDELERNLSNQLKEQRDQIRQLKDDLHKMEQEDKNNKKQLVELSKGKGKCQELEKELQLLSMKGKDQEFQIADLSGLVKASENRLLEIKNLKSTIADLQTNFNDSQLTNKQLSTKISLLQTKLDEQIQTNQKQKKLVEELTDEKNYLCSLEAKNTQILSQERKANADSNEQIKKLEQKLSSQATLLYLKQSQKEENEIKLRQSQALFSAKKEEIEYLQKLQKENEELKEKCICKKFPKLFAECHKLYENLLMDDIDDFAINYEDQYMLVLQSDYNKLHNLIKIFTKNQSNYKKCFNKLNERPQQLEIELQTLKNQVALLEQVLKDSQFEKQNLIEVVKNVSLSQNQKDMQRVLRDVIYNNLNGVVKAQESEMQYLKTKNLKLQNEIKTFEINHKNSQNQIEDLEDTIQVTSVVLKSLQKNKNIMQQIIQFTEHCVQVEILLQNSQILSKRVEEQLSTNQNTL